MTQNTGQSEDPKYIYKKTKKTVDNLLKSFAKAVYSIVQLSKSIGFMQKHIKSVSKPG